MLSILDIILKMYLKIHAVCDTQINTVKII